MGEVKRVDGYSVALADPAIALPTITHTGIGAGQSYTLTLRPVVHPQHDVLLVAYTLTGAPVERLRLVTNRYQGAAVPTSGRWFWRDATPGTSLPAGRTLVVADTQGFTLHYGFDDWDPSTVAERASAPLGLGLSGVTLTPMDLQGRSSLQFVRRYDDGSWEGARRHDVALQAEPAAAVPRHPRHAAALHAAGIGA